MTAPALTQEMIDAIQAFAAKRDAIPQNVLRRMVFGYIAKYDKPPVEPDSANVVSIRGRGE